MMMIGDFLSQFFLFWENLRRKFVVEIIFGEKKIWWKDRRGQGSHACELGISAKVPYMSELYGIGHLHHYVY